MCSGSEAGSFLRLIDCVYHSTLGLRVIKKQKKKSLALSLLVAPSTVGFFDWLKCGECAEWWAVRCNSCWSAFQLTCGECFGYLLTDARYTC